MYIPFNLHALFPFVRPNEISDTHRLPMCSWGMSFSMLKTTYENSLYQFCIPVTHVVVVILKENNCDEGMKKGETLPLNMVSNSKRAGARYDFLERVKICRKKPHQQTRLYFSTTSQPKY